MSNEYTVRLTDGSTYTVTTTRHHDDHPFDEFARHLLDIIKGSVGGVIAGTVVHFLHKGRK